MNPFESSSKSNLGTSRSIPLVKDLTLEDCGEECVSICGMCGGEDHTIGVITPFEGVGPPPVGVNDPEDPATTLA